MYIFHPSIHSPDTALKKPPPHCGRLSWTAPDKNYCTVTIWLSSIFKPYRRTCQFTLHLYSWD